MRKHIAVVTGTMSLGFLLTFTTLLFAQEPPAAIDPANATYRIRLAGCLLGEQPLTLVLRMDRGRIVQSWAHPFRSNHPYVQVDVSRLKLEGNELAGPVSGIIDWNLYELTMQSRIVSNKVTGTYKGRFGDVDVSDVQLAVSGDLISAPNDTKDLKIRLELLHALHDGPIEARGAAFSLDYRDGKWTEMRVEPLEKNAAESWKGSVTESTLSLNARELTGELSFRVSAESGVSDGEYRIEFHAVREGPAIAGMAVSHHPSGTNETGVIGFCATVTPAADTPRFARMVLEGAIAGAGSRRDAPRYPIWVFIPMQDVSTANASVVSPVSMRIQSAFLGRFKRDGLALAGEAGIVFDYDGQFPESGEPVRCRYEVNATVSGDRLAGTYKGTTGARKDVGGSVTGTVEPWPANTFRDGDAWTGWRGPHSNGSADSTNHVFVGHLADATFVWRTEATNLPWGNWVWEEDRCPGGYSDFAFMNNALYMAYAVPGEKVINTRFFGSRGAGESEFMYRIRRGMGTVSADDCLIAVDAPSGRTLWTSVLKDRGMNHWATSAVACGFPLITPWAENNRVYTYGTAGRIFCRDGATGELLWESDVGEASATIEAILQVFSIPALNEAFAASQKPGKAGKFGFAGRLSCTAIIAADGIVACNDYGDIQYGPRNATATNGQSILRGCGAIGLDAETGRPVWRFDNCQVPSADMPIRWVHEGKPFFICVGPQRMLCIEPKTGRKVWEYDTEYPLLRGGTPAVAGDYLVVQGEHSHGHARITTRTPGQPNPFKGGGLTCFKLSMRGPEVIWAVPMSEELFGPDASILVYNGVVYSGNKGRDLLTGKPVMSHTFSLGYAPIGTDGYVVSGRLGIYPVDPSRKAEKSKEAGNPLLRKLSGGPDWNAPRQSEYISPVVVDGRFFVRGWHELYCFDIRKERPAAPISAVPAERNKAPSTSEEYLVDLSSRFQTRRTDAVAALLAVERKQWLPTAASLATIAEDGSWPAMTAACDALRRMGRTAAPVSGRVRNALLKRVDEARWGSAVLCVDTLAAIDPLTLEASAAEVAERLKGDAKQSRVACAALGRMGSAAGATTPALVALLAGDDTWLAEGAARAIADIGKAARDAVPALSAELERHRPRVAVQCARALANIGGPEADAAAPALTRAFTTGAQPLSTHAAIALATLSPEAAKEAVQVAASLLSRTRASPPAPIRIAAEVIVSRAGTGKTPPP